MYHQFNTQKFHVLPTQCIYMFCMDLRTNSNYFPIQHWLTGCYNRDLTLCSPVVTICTTRLTFNNSTYFQHSVFMFCMDLRTNSDYFPIQHWLAGFYDRDLTLCSPVVTICTISLTLKSSMFCLHNVFICLDVSQNKQRLFPYTAFTEWFLYPRFNPL